MAKNEVAVRASPEQVFDVLLDPYAYPRWVVGTKEIRTVDAGWPASGTAFHHSVGAGPFEVRDKTSVISSSRPHELVLRVRARLLGIIAITRISVEPAPEGARIVLEENPEPVLLRRLWNPVADGMVRLRNAESLRRLKSVVEERARSGAV